MSKARDERIKKRYEYLCELEREKRESAIESDRERAKSNPFSEELSMRSSLDTASVNLAYGGTLSMPVESYKKMYQEYKSLGYNSLSCETFTDVGYELESKGKSY